MERSYGLSFFFIRRYKDMMMLRVENNSSAVITITPGVQIAAGGFKLFPADRCTWDYEYSNNQYDIMNAEFFLGASTTGEPTAVVGLNGTNRRVSLGFIGKSGRFVEIAN